MRILALDTSTFVGSAAVLRDGELLAEWSAFVRASHGETVLPHVERVLEAAGLTLADIDAFAVGIGPGSFTGVRIGVATAKGFALAQKKPIVGVTSLRAIARGMSAGEGLIAPLLDAYKSEVYAAAYAMGSQGELIERVAPFHARPDVAAARLRTEAGAAPVWMAGSGVAKYRDVLRAALGTPCMQAPAYGDVPRAACIAHEAALALVTTGPSDLATLEPLYVRPSDAKLPDKPLDTRG